MAHLENIDNQQVSINTQISKKSKALPPWMLFAREVFRAPSVMAAVCPSSPQLAKAIAQSVNYESGMIVELGSGTGIMIEALLRQGVPPERLIAIEQSANLTNYLHQRFPSVRIVKGDAVHLRDLLGENCQVGTIVSGLPMRTTMPLHIVQPIVNQIDELLPKGGFFIEYTYFPKRMKYLPPHFEWVSCKRVWTNIPPANVNVYQSVF